MLSFFVQIFAAFLEDRAAWRSYLVDKFPHDALRNERSAEELKSLAAYVRALPADDPTLQRLAILHRSNRDQYLPGERARYAIERYGFHEVTPAAMFLDDLVDLTVADVEDVPDGVPPVHNED